MYRKSEKVVKLRLLHKCMKYVSYYQKLYIIGKLNQFPVHTTTKNLPASIAAPLVVIFHYAILV